MIKIEDLIPLLKEGWVAMDSSTIWYWFEYKPRLGEKIWEVCDGDWSKIYCYVLKEIAPADDWTQSLIEVKHNEH